MNIPGYKIIQPIDSSESGTVYLGTELESGHPVVVKYLPKSLLDHAALNRDVDRFIREGEVAKQISHPNIVQLREVGQNLEALYTVVDYVPGENLAQRAVSLCLLDKIYVVKQLAEALDYLAAHRAGHFNLKPSNIILSSETSRAMMTDFGFMRGMYQESEQLLKNKLLETADYTSPEQHRKETLDLRADLYSLGAVFCFLLTGKAPFKYGVEAVGAKQAGTSFVELPNELSIFQEFVDYALAKMPDDRFQSGKEMVEELEKIDDEIIIGIEGHQIEAPKKSGKKAKATNNVYQLSQAAKAKQQELFKKLLAPKEETAADKPAKNETQKQWSDIPPTKFTNNYNVIEGLDAAAGKEKRASLEEQKISDVVTKIIKPQNAIKMEKLKDSESSRSVTGVKKIETSSVKSKASHLTSQASKLQPKSKPVIGLVTGNQIKNKKTELMGPRGKSGVSVKQTENATPVKTVLKAKHGVERELTKRTSVKISRTVNSSLSSPIRSPVFMDKKNRIGRVSLFIFLLMICVGLYLTYQEKGTLSKPQLPSLPNNKPVNLNLDLFLDKTRDRLEEIQLNLREGVYEILSDQGKSSAENNLNESRLVRLPVLIDLQADTLPQKIQVHSQVEQKEEKINKERIAAVRELRQLQKQEKIDKLLAQAETLKNEGKLLYPADFNAVTLYKQVLDLSPSNFVAISEMRSIRSDAIEQIELMLKLDHINAADAMLTRVNIFFTPAPPVDELASRINAKRQTP
ncbi:MAG: protein kinase [Pseudomonadales bacterium]|nr:protein kinase [Pseudomonadales bacterium]